MFQITVAGRVGQAREVKEVAGSSVLNFSVATDVGFGDKKQTIWFDCAVWGKRAESLAPYVTKGTPVTVTGEGGEREYEGKDGSTRHQITIRVSDVALQGKKGDDEEPRDQYSNEKVPARGRISQDDVPFNSYERGWIA